MSVVRDERTGLPLLSPEATLLDAEKLNTPGGRPLTRQQRRAAAREAANEATRELLGGNRKMRRALARRLAGAVVQNNRPGQKKTESSSTKDVQRANES